MKSMAWISRPPESLERLAQRLGPTVESIGGDLLQSMVESSLFGAPMPTVGRFELRRMLGRGGMGIVYLAHDPDLDRLVAIKVLHPRSTDEGPKDMRDEAAGLARLTHPNVVTVHEIGEQAGRLFLVMEFVDGSALDVHCRRLADRLGLDSPAYRSAVVGTVIGAGRGLAAIHRAGLVHRDFKPGNVLVGVDGRPRVTDFGLARWVEASDSTGRDSGPGDAIVGTLAFMPPEQLRGEPANGSSDLFAFCDTLHTTLTGSAAYPTHDPRARLDAIERGVLGQPLAHIPGSLRAILERGLQAEPDARWPDMDAVLQALEAWTAPRRPRWPLAIGGIGILGAVALLTRPDATACDRTDEAIAAVWNDETRQALRHSYGAVDRPYAASALAVVERDLDAYVERWKRVSRDSCVATRIDGVQSETGMDRRTACLARRARALRRSLETLVAAEHDTVQRADVVVAGLPSIEACSQPELVDTAARREDPRLRDELDAVNIAWLAGEAEHAEAAAAALLPRCQDAPALRAELEWLIARILHARGAIEPALETLDRALLSAAEAGDDAVAARIQTTLLFMQARVHPDWALLRVLSTQAAAALTRAGSPPDIVVLYEQSRAHALAAVGRYTEAIEADRAALDAIDAGGMGERRQGLAWLDLAQNQQQAGLLDEASASLSRADERLRSILGPGHPLRVGVDNTAGDIAFSRGDYAAARQGYMRAAATLEAELGPDHPRTLAAQGKIATTLEALGRPDEALRLHERVVEGHARVFGTEHVAYATALEQLGISANASGDPHRSVEAFRKALAIRVATQGERHADVSYTRLNIAAALLETDAWAQARREARAAVDIASDPTSADPLIAGLAHDMLARCDLHDDAPKSAATHLAMAEGSLDAIRDSASLEWIGHLMLRGDVALALGRRGEAIAAYGEAESIARANLGRASIHATEAERALTRARAAPTSYRPSR